MAHTVEQISIWILEAVEKEWCRESNIAMCRPSSEVLGEVMAEHGVTNDEISRAIIFMAAPSRAYLDICNRGDGQAILPSDNGLVMIAKIRQSRIDDVKEEADAKKLEIERKQDFRLKIYPIIISILGLVIAYLSYRLAALSHTATRHDDFSAN